MMVHAVIFAFFNRHCDEHLCENHLALAKFYLSGRVDDWISRGLSELQVHYSILNKNWLVAEITAYKSFWAGSNLQNKKNEREV